jgi:hypothetical protein
MYGIARKEAGMGEDFPFRYLAGFESSSDRDEAPPRGMERWEIGSREGGVSSGQRYAVFAHRCGAHA